MTQSRGCTSRVYQKRLINSPRSVLADHLSHAAITRRHEQVRRHRSKTAHLRRQGMTRAGFTHFSARIAIVHWPKRHAVFDDLNPLFGHALKVKGQRRALRVQTIVPDGDLRAQDLLSNAVIHPRAPFQ